MGVTMENERELSLDEVFDTKGSHGSAEGSWGFASIERRLDLNMSLNLEQQEGRMQKVLQRMNVPIKSASTTREDSELSKLPQQREELAVVMDSLEEDLATAMNDIRVLGDQIQQKRAHTQQQQWQQRRLTRYTIKTAKPPDDEESVASTVVSEVSTKKKKTKKKLMVRDDDDDELSMASSIYSEVSNSTPPRNKKGKKAKKLKEQEDASSDVSDMADASEAIKKKRKKKKKKSGDASSVVSDISESAHKRKVSVKVKVVKKKKDASLHKRKLKIMVKKNKPLGVADSTMDDTEKTQPISDEDSVHSAKGRLLEVSFFDWNQWKISQSSPSFNWEQWRKSQQGKTPNKPQRKKLSMKNSSDHTNRRFGRTKKPRKPISKRQVKSEHRRQTPLMQLLV